MTEAPTSADAPRSPNSRLAAVLLLVCASMAIPDRNAIVTFFEPTTEARVLPIQALVHYGDSAMDAMSCRIATTHDPVDKAVVDGRTYSHKAPGMFWLGVPAYWLATRLSGGQLVPFTTAASVLGLLCSLLPILLVAWFWGRWLIARLGPPGGHVALLALLLASPIYVYATMFTDYAPATFVMLGGYLLLRRGGLARAGVGGLLLGLAGAMNYWLLACGAIAGAVELARRVVTRDRPWATAAAATAGVLLIGVCFATYDALIWGSPWAQSYDFLGPVARSMHERMHFEWSTFLAGLVGDRRGLFTTSPWTLPGLAGLAFMLRAPTLRWEGLTGLLITGATLVFQAIYVSTNPDMLAFSRHALPALPWLALGLGHLVASALRQVHRAGAPSPLVGAGLAALGAALLWSFFVPFAVGWTYPYHSDGVQNHLWNVQMMMFFGGDHLPLRSFAPLFDRLWVWGREAAGAHWPAVGASLGLALLAAVVAHGPGRALRPVPPRRHRALAWLTAAAVLALLVWSSHIGFVGPQDELRMKTIIARGAAGAPVSKAERRFVQDTRTALKAGQIAQLDVLQSYVGGGPASYHGFSEHGYRDTNPHCAAAGLLPP
ncbi:MAG: hypothetical protein H6746_02785 [Deltaproteobacteria bacterium]|nr:hypothetical protein [Deltaproteobacteria bacterium]